MINLLEEILNIIKENTTVNYSFIAQKFNINNVTASDLVKMLEKENKVTIVKGKRKEKAERQSKSLRELLAES